MIIPGSKYLTPPLRTPNLRIRGVRVSLSDFENLNWGVRVSLSGILRIRGVCVSLLDSENLN